MIRVHQVERQHEADGKPKDVYTVWFRTDEADLTLELHDCELRLLVGGLKGEGFDPDRPRLVER